MIAVAAAGLAAPAAGAVSFSPQYEACMQTAGGVTSSMRDCAAAEGKRIDANLNREYRLALARLPTRAKKEALRRSQRAWLSKRYDHCAEQARELEGGTLWLVAMDGCALASDAQRVAWLKHYGR